MQDQSTASETEIAWAAGLFEGEGCWNVYVRPSGKLQIQASLGMTDRDVVERFAAIVGCGSVCHSRDDDADRLKGWKVIHTWRVYEAEKVREVVALLMPYLGERRRAKAQDVLTRGADIQPHHKVKTHCPKGHPLSGDNLIEEPIARAGRNYVARRCRTCRTLQSRERARVARRITPDRFRKP